MNSIQTNRSTATRTIATILGAGAAAATLMIALAPAWVPARAHDALRVVELPRVVISAQRDRIAAAPEVVELPRVVITGQRVAPSAGRAFATNGVQPVMAALPR